MKLKLLLLLVFTLRNVFSQNTNTVSALNNNAFSDSTKKVESLQKLRNHVKGDTNFEIQYFNENLNKNAKTALLEKHRLWINMTNTQGAFKQLLIGYIEGATNGLDNDFDGISLDANPYIDFYSVNSGSNLVIQGRALPFSDGDEVQLGYRTIITGKFTISIDHADGLLTNQAVFLEDKLTNIVHDLRLSDYTFATTAGTFKNRFILKYKNPSLTAYGFENANSVLVSVDNESINISSALQNINNIFVYATSGKLIYNQQAPVSTNKINITDIKHNNELLLMKIILNNNQIETRKIIY